MKVFLTSALVLLASCIFGQQLFYKTFPKPDWDYADAVIERSDGNYLMAGSSRSQHGTDYDISLILVDSLGNTIWDKYIGLPDSMEFAYSLIETSDGNYMVSGRIGMYFPYLVIFDANGDPIRDIRYPEVDQSYGAYSVGETAGNNYYFIQPGPVSTFYVINPLGDIILSKSYDYAYCNAVIQTSDMGYMLTGHVESQYGHNEYVMIRTDTNGDTLWTKKLGDEGFIDGISQLQLEDEGFIVAGSYNDPDWIDEPEAAFLLRTDSYGDTLWTRNYWIGTPVCIKECRFNSGYILSSRMYVSIGGIYPDEYYLFITRLDTLGNILWSRQFEGYTFDFGNNVTQTCDGGFLLTGHIEGNPAGTDAILIKLDSLGDYILSAKEIDFPASSEILTYPNPAKDFLNFRLPYPDIKIKELRIFNISGQEINIRQVASGNVTAINLSGHAPGIYFYCLTTRNNRFFKGKFVISN